jgi:two-component system NarL family sensor kinase
VEVSDDGVGLGDRHPIGVGLTSMRERAEELGGSLTVERLPQHGTRIRAELP